MTKIVPSNTLSLPRQENEIQQSVPLKYVEGITKRFGQLGEEQKQNFTKNQKILECIQKGLAGRDSYLQAVAYATEAMTPIESRKFIEDLQSLMATGRWESIDKTKAKIDWLLEQIESMSKEYECLIATNSRPSEDTRLAPRDDSRLLNKQDFCRIMHEVKNGLLSPCDNINVDAEREILKAMADKAERLGGKVSDGRYENKLHFKRYNLDSDGLYEKLRTFSIDLVNASKKCESHPAINRLQKVAAVVELLAQQHNTALISAHYDDKARKLEAAHGKHFEGPRVSNQAISHGKDFGLSVGGGVGYEVEGNGASAKLTGQVGTGNSKTIATDFDGTAAVIHRRNYNLGLKGAAGGGVTITQLASLEGNLGYTRSNALYTEHKSHADAFKGMVTDTRETYIHKNPLLYFEQRGYKPKELAEAEIEAINRATTFGPLNALRNVGEDVRSWWNSGQGGIDHGERPFNELTFLKAQGGASKHLMTNLLRYDDDPALRHLAQHLGGQPKLPLTAPSNKTHHTLMGTITTDKGEVSGKVAAGWYSKQVNSKDTHPVGMGVYAKASAWVSDTKYGFSLITPPHDVVKRMAEHYRDGEAGALQYLLEEHPKFQGYQDKLKGPSGDNARALVHLERDLTTFREQCTRMQSAKALLLNRQSCSNPLLAKHAWNEFQSAHLELSNTFGLKPRNFRETPPVENEDHQARIDLVSDANNQLSDAWTALSLGMAYARMMPRYKDKEEYTQRLDKLANEIAEVDIPSVHPLTAYGHSPIRLQSIDYKKVEMGLSAGASFDLKLPSPIATTNADKTGSGAIKGLLGTSASVGATITVMDEDKAGHPNPVRNGTFRTLAVDLKLQIPSLPGTPNPLWLIRTVSEKTASRVAEHIQQDPQLQALDQAERERMADIAHRDVKAQVIKMLTHGQLPNNFTYTYEAQWHKMKGAKEFSNAYGQHRLTVEANHSVELPISAYAGLGVEIKISASDKNATTLASMPRLGGSVYGHLLQYHDNGVLKPLVVREGAQPRMNWDRLNDDGNERRADLAAMYFSNDGVLDFLSECATLGDPSFQGGGDRGNTAQILVGQIANEGGGERWRTKCELNAIDINNIETVRQATKGMNARQRLDYFREDDTANALFNKYLAQVEFLQACNNYGKLSPNGQGWKLTPIHPKNPMHDQRI